MNIKLIAKFKNGDKITTLVETAVGFLVSQNSPDRFWSELLKTYEDAYRLYMNTYLA